MTTHPATPRRWTSPHASRPDLTTSAAAIPPATYPMVRLAPPYRDRTPFLPSALASPSPLDDGTILGIRLQTTVTEWSSIEAQLDAMRGAFPSHPVVLLIDAARSDALEVGIRAARLPFRGVLRDDAAPEAGLRAELTAWDRIPEQVVEWLGLRGYRLRPVILELIYHLVRLAPRHAEVGPLLAEIGSAQSTTRFRMRKKGLPAPSRWLAATRALHAALRLQAAPNLSMTDLAHDLGFADHSALSHLVWRAFRVRPRDLRHVLGWEWLLDRWLQQEFAGAPRSGRRSSF